MKKQDEGFTLIELLIVIVILGILATVVVFAVGGIRDSGDKSACEAELRSVETAIEAFYAQAGSYATSDAELDLYFKTARQYWQYNGTWDEPVALKLPATGTGATASCG